MAYHHFPMHEIEAKEIWDVVKPDMVREAVRRKVFISVPLGRERSSLPAKVIC